MASEAARSYDIDPKFILSMIKVESNFNTFAIRYEPAFFKRYIEPKTSSELSGYIPKNVTISTERIARATSWGLMQVMGETARSIGRYKLDFISELTRPDIGVDMGCTVLAYYIKRHGGDIEKAIQAYNAGIPSPAGQKYLTKVLTEYNKL